MIDANVVIKWAVPEVDSDKARVLLNTWEQEKIVLLAPAFFLAELDSILRQKVVAKKELTPAKAQACWEQLQPVPVALADMMSLRQRAWEISIELGHAHVYDSIYVALAEACGCEFWTADQRLVNAAQDRFPFIKSLNDFTPPTESTDTSGE